MRDVSEQGALLEVLHPEWLPTRFRLIVDALGIESDCEVVRRTDGAVGVRFTSPINAGWDEARGRPQRAAGRP